MRSSGRQVQGFRWLGTMVFLAAFALSTPPIQAQDPEQIVRDRLSGQLAEIADPGPELVRAAAVHGQVEGHGEAFYLAGRSQLPARALLYVHIVYEGKQVESRRTLVGEDGAFDCILGPFVERRILRGPYLLQVVYHPGRQPVAIRRREDLPREVRAFDLEVWVGDETGRQADRETERVRYRKDFERIETLLAELEAEARAAARKEKFTLGAEKHFDEIAWRRWIDGWRERLQEGVWDGLRVHRDAEVLALCLPEAHQSLQSMAAILLELQKAYSREVYETHGRETAPGDRFDEGGSRLNRAALLGQYEQHRKAAERGLR